MSLTSDNFEAVGPAAGSGISIGFWTSSGSQSIYHYGAQLFGTQGGVFAGCTGPGDGVYGVASGTSSSVGGVHGGSSAPNGNGVIGEADNGSNAYGVWGTSTSGFAGYFNGKVHIVGDLTVTGAKSAVVPFPDGSHRQLYCVESPESWFEDVGFGQLRDGQAQVALDADFAATVNTDSYHVFITEYEDNSALYVTGRTSSGFRVQAKSPQTGDGAFSYRIVAKRKDISGRRLERVTLTSKKRPDPAK